MDVDAVFRVVLVVLLWGMIGYWGMTVRRIRRLERHAPRSKPISPAPNSCSPSLDRGPWAGLIDEQEPPAH